MHINDGDGQWKRDEEEGKLAEFIRKEGECVLAGIQSLWPWTLDSGFGTTLSMTVDDKNGDNATDDDNGVQWLFYSDAGLG